MFGKPKQPSEFCRPRQTKNSLPSIVRKTALLNPSDDLAFIQPESISTEWTGEPSFGFVLLARELRRSIRVYPDCNLWRALLSLEVNTQTILYASLIKGWSSSRIAETLEVSLITVQELLESGREDLKRRLAEPALLCE